MGWVATTLAEPISLQRFINLGFQYVTFSDFLPSTFKTAVFGGIIGVVSCFQGMRATRRAARGRPVRHQLGRAFVAVRHPRRCRAGSFDPGAFVRRHGRSTDSPAIALHGLHNQFGRQTVLTDVNLTRSKGETVAVLGRSGIGKSVLLKFIVGLEHADSGSIGIDGQDIVGLPDCEAQSDPGRGSDSLPACGALRLAHSRGQCGVSTIGTAMLAAERRDRARTLSGRRGDG